MCIHSFRELRRPLTEMALIQLATFTTVSFLCLCSICPNGCSGQMSNVVIL